MESEFFMALVHSAESNLTPEQRRFLRSASKPCLQLVLPNDFESVVGNCAIARGVLDLAKTKIDMRDPVKTEMFHDYKLPSGSFLSVVGTEQNPMQFVGEHKIKAGA